MNLQRFDDSTLIRIFALHELHRLKEHGLTRGALLDYHSRYKLVFLAHSQPEYQIGRASCRERVCQYV